MAKSRFQVRSNGAQSVPLYELRARYVGPGRDSFEIWQVPSKATPQVRKPVRIARLEGRNLELVQHRILRILAEQRIRVTGQPRRTQCIRPVPEVLAVRLGLMFRTLAPMRDRRKIWAVVDGIEEMEREEAAYWLGMAIHREHPRRVLASLRVLLTEPDIRPLAMLSSTPVGKESDAEL